MRKPCKFSQNGSPKPAKNRFLFTNLALLLSLQANFAQQPSLPCHLNYQNELPYPISIDIKEIAPKQFVVTKEMVLRSIPGTHHLTVFYRNGDMKEYNWAQIQALMSNPNINAACDTALHGRSREFYNYRRGKLKTVLEFEPNYNHSVHSLPYVIMGSMLGYALGKGLHLPPNPNVYQFPEKQYEKNQHINSYWLDESDLHFKYLEPVSGHRLITEGWGYLPPKSLKEEQQIKLDNFKKHKISHDPSKPEEEKKPTYQHENTPSSDNQQHSDHQSDNKHRSSAPNDGKSGFLDNKSKLHDDDDSEEARRRRARQHDNDKAPHKSSHSTHRSSHSG